MFSKVSGWRLGLAFVATATACGGHTRQPGNDDAGTGGATATTAGRGSRADANTAGLATVGGTSTSQPDVGIAPDQSQPWKSSGCGRPLPAEQVPTIPGSRTGYTEWQVQQTGATLGAVDESKAGPRQFFVRVPVDYDQDKPYRVVYIGQGCGANHAGAMNTYPLFDETRGGTEQAIYVGVSVPDNAANPSCYDNNSGPQSQEWEAFELMHTLVESHYCVDNNRIFVAGYGTGAWLANMWGCYFGGAPAPPLDEPDVSAGRNQRPFAPHWALRGTAGVSGSLPTNQPLPCNGAAAHIWIHDAEDASDPIASDIRALEVALQTNGCVGNYADGPKQPWAPAQDIPTLEGVCQEYTGCPAEVAKDYPLVFCTTNGHGHTDQSFDAIPAFAKFFEQLAAK